MGGGTSPSWGGSPPSPPMFGSPDWWCLKFGPNEVVNLVMRHFEHAQVYNSCLTLANSCDLPKPIIHRSTAARQALKPCSNDLVKIMKELVENEQVSNIVITAIDLGKVPLDTLRGTLKKTVYLKTLSKLMFTSLPPTLFLTKC